MLEQLTGPERFLELTQRLQREYRWRRLAPAELQLEAEKAAGRPLDWFFSDWVENDRALRVEIDSVTTLPDGAVEVRVRHAGTARMPVNCEVRREDGTGVRLRLERDPAEQVLRFEQAAPVRLVRLDPEHRLPLFDPENKSWRGRPWVTMKVEGLRLLARNEGREDHAVRLSAGQGKRARSRQRTLRPGEEMTLDLPEADAPTVGYDLTDHVKLPLSGPRD
jgi:aminopeptidase N